MEAGLDALVFTFDFHVRIRWHFGSRSPSVKKARPRGHHGQLLFSQVYTDSFFPRPRMDLESDILGLSMISYLVSFFNQTFPCS